MATDTTKVLESVKKAGRNPKFGITRKPRK